jgi:hypothetical protein
MSGLPVPSPYREPAPPPEKEPTPAESEWWPREDKPREWLELILGLLGLGLGG